MVELSDVVVDDFAVANALSLITDEHKDLMENFKVTIEPDECTNELGGEFICVICRMVVSEPKECPKCSNLLCNECLQQYSSRAMNTNCPHCRERTLL